MIDSSTTTRGVAPHVAGLVAVDGRTYPLSSARIESRVEGGVAFTTLLQRYCNPHAEPLEVVYRLPLPADGAVVGYSMKLGERTIRGEVRPRAEAAAAYRSALLDGRAAGLLEQERADTFTQRLGSLPAGVPVDLRIEVLQPLGFLPAAGDEKPRWEWRFPTVVGVRYQGGADRVADADRLDADRAAEAGTIPVRFELALRIAGVSAAVTSPSHQLVCEPGTEHTQVSLAERARLDRDLIVRWEACAPRVGAALVEGPGLPGDPGRYGLLTLTPPSVPLAVFSRDLTLLIDASGSMSGPPIDWARRIACGLLEGLGESDHFSVIAFGDRPQELTSGHVQASASARSRAERAIHGIQAGGGTEMTRALYAALTPLRREAQRQIVLITDGYVGFESEIVEEVTRNLPERSRLHVVGVGAAPNRTLTIEASRAGRGVEAFASSEGDVPQAIQRLVQATARPVLVDVAVAGSALCCVAPRRPRDLYAGQPLVLALDLEPAGGRIEVTGRLAGEGSRWSWAVDLAAQEAHGEGALAIGALFGRERIADLELDLVGAGKRRGSIAQIEATALRHCIASRFTSLVAVAEEPTVDPRQPRRSEVLAVELPAFVSAEGTGLIEAPMMGHQYQSLVYLQPTSFAVGGETLARRASLRGVYFKLAALTEWAMPLPSIEGTHDVPTGLDLGEAAVIDIEDSRVVLEIRVPGVGFVVPEGNVDVVLDGNRQPLGRIDTERSTPRGPHEKDTIVRIVIVLVQPLIRPCGDTTPRVCEIGWVSPWQLDGVDVGSTIFHLRFSVPPG